MGYVYNYAKLKGKIKEIYGTQNNFAEAMNLTGVSISKKLNNKVDWTQGEIVEASKLLNIEDCQIKPYFFTYNVQNN